MRMRSTVLFVLSPMRLAAMVGGLSPVVVCGLSPDARADDAMTQCIASSEQGLDLRKQEKLLDARKVLATCATTRCPDEIRTTCEQRISDINGVLPSIVFDVKDASGNDLPGAKLTVDGTLASTQLAGRSTPVDPGPHTFTIEVPGQPPVERKLVLNEGEKDRHERVVVGAPPSPLPAGPAPAGPSGGAPTASPPEPAPLQSPSTSSTQRTVGLVLGGVGVGGIVFGSVLGLVASSKWSSAKSDCGQGCLPSAPAQQEKSDAQSAATLSTVGFIGGAGLLAAGVVIYFTAPSAPAKGAIGALSVTPSAGPGQAGLLVRGGF
jgi:hypothetical protein